MRNYELFVIVHPDLDENNFKAVIEKVSGWVTEFGGSVDKLDVWGRRRMAYQINKQREGQYALLHLIMDPKTTEQLERNIRFNESIIRSMITVAK
jgi:small subunit ribosomal protein S6